MLTTRTMLQRVLQSVLQSVLQLLMLQLLMLQLLTELKVLPGGLSVCEYAS